MWISNYKFSYLVLVQAHLATMSALYASTWAIGIVRQAKLVGERWQGNPSMDFFTHRMALISETCDNFHHYIFEMKWAFDAK